MSRVRWRLGVQGSMAATPVQHDVVPRCDGVQLTVWMTHKPSLHQARRPLLECLRTCHTKTSGGHQWIRRGM